MNIFFQFFYVYISSICPYFIVYAFTESTNYLKWSGYVRVMSVCFHKKGNSPFLTKLTDISRTSRISSLSHDSFASLVDQHIRNGILNLHFHQDIRHLKNQGTIYIEDRHIIDVANKKFKGINSFITAGFYTSTCLYIILLPSSKF